MFHDTMRRWTEGIRDAATQFNLIRLFYPLFDRSSSLLMNSGGLEISGTATLAKTANTIYFFAKGVPGSLTTSNMAALSGTVVNATFNVFCFFIDSAGNLTSAMGTAGATYAAVVFPQFPENKALIGFIIINPTGTGNFVGGTTGLADSTVVPNTVYVNTPMGFDPAAVTGLSATP